MLRVNDSVTVISLESRVKGIIPLISGEWNTMIFRDLYDRWNWIEWELNGWMGSCEIWVRGFYLVFFVYCPTMKAQMMNANSWSQYYMCRTISKRNADMWFLVSFSSMNACADLWSFILFFCMTTVLDSILKRGCAVYSFTFYGCNNKHHSVIESLTVSNIVALCNLWFCNCTWVAHIAHAHVLL